MTNQNRKKQIVHFWRRSPYSMPAEFSPHAGCIVVWPERPGSWKEDPRPAREAFAKVIAAIAESEHVYVAVSESSLSSAVEMLFEGKALAGVVPKTYVWGKQQYNPHNDSECRACNFDHRTETENEAEPEKANVSWRSQVELFLQETDDSWARDIGPTFVIARRNGALCGINWCFNAWGGNVNGLYAHWARDDAFAAAFCEKYGFSCLDALPFVMEGGAIASDGEGTLLTTEACLLDAGRNPSFTKKQIARRLRFYLGAKKILWLPHGIYGDETKEHVDNMAAFLAPGRVVLAWTDDRHDPQYAYCQAAYAYLEKEKDARGRKLEILKLPLPDVPICLTKEDIAGFCFEEGEDTREVGEKMAASYVNFYFSDDAVILPAFGGENAESDKRAATLLAKWCPERKICPVPAREILLGGGNIHCITQQIPKENNL